MNMVWTAPIYRQADAMRTVDPRAGETMSSNQVKVTAAEKPNGKLAVRQIQDVDLEAVMMLLVRGFPERNAAYWQRGFEYLRTRPMPEAYPRYGYVMTRGDQMVGVLLLIFATADDGSVRANVSSWYLDPAYRIYSNMLIGPALRMPGVTLFNISPAPQTIDSIRTQRFIQYVSGTYFALAALGKIMPRVSIKWIQGSTSPDASLLEQHAARGCIALELTADGETFPFIFVKGLAFSSRLRCVQLLYCRDQADFVKFAGPLGRWLLLRGFPFVMMDAVGSIPGLRGRYFEGRRKKFYRGDISPRLGDLSLTELMVFGP